MSTPEQGGEPISPEGLAELRADIEELEGPGRNAIAERIKDARDLGDLKENAEYHIAKEDQAHLETKIKRLRQRLQNSVEVKVDTKASTTFAFGRTAEVLDDATGKSSEWTLVGPTEADLKEGKLSAESPVGKALRDAVVGEPVKVETPGGSKTYVVKKLI
jgi:transcription elongation factor GreA